MGCCLSSHDAATPKSDDHVPVSDGKGGAFPRPPPPPPPPPEEEEETVVKEVLSETPIPKPPTPSPIQLNIEENKRPDEFRKLRVESTAAIKAVEEIVVSEVSEVCSFTESFSTTTAGEKREEEGEVTQMVKSSAKVPGKRTISGEVAWRKERGGSPSPAKKLPERRQLAPRSAQSRTTMTQRRNVGPSNGIRRDPAGGSGRRSRSPVRRGEAAESQALKHRSPITSSAGRFGAGSPARTGENEEMSRRRNDGVSRESGEVESLENPLVSLECFIFL